MESPLCLYDFAALNHPLPRDSSHERSLACSIRIFAPNPNRLVVLTRL
jgi:hypothetical protein